MLPIITEDLLSQVYEEVFSDVAVWRKKMVGHLKEENPEINSAILEITKRTELDPKAVALGAYLTYRLIEEAIEENESVDTQD